MARLAFLLEDRRDVFREGRRPRRLGRVGGDRCTGDEEDSNERQVSHVHVHYPLRFDKGVGGLIASAAVEVQSTIFRRKTDRTVGSVNVRLKLVLVRLKSDAAYIGTDVRC